MRKRLFAAALVWAVYGIEAAVVILLAIIALEVARQPRSLFGELQKLETERLELERQAEATMFEPRTSQAVPGGEVVQLHRPQGVA